MRLHNRTMRFLAVLLAVALVIPNGLYMTSAATSGASLTLTTADILKAVEHGAGSMGYYTVDSVPTVTVRDENGDPLDTYEAPEMGLQASHTLESEIGDFLESLRLPYEEEGSVLLRSELMEALEGSWPVKVFSGQNVIVVIEPSSHDLMLLAVNPSSNRQRYSLTVTDPEGRELNMTQTSSLIRKAALMELSEEELAWYYGNAELLEISRTMAEIAAPEELEEAPVIDLPEEEELGVPAPDDGEGEPDPSGTAGEPVDESWDDREPVEEEDTQDPEDGMPVFSEPDGTGEDNESDGLGRDENGDGEEAESQDNPADTDSSAQEDSDAYHASAESHDDAQGGILRSLVHIRPTTLRIGEGIGHTSPASDTEEPETALDGGPEQEQEAMESGESGSDEHSTPPSLEQERAFQVVETRYTAVIATDEDGGINVDNGSVTFQVPGNGWGAVTVSLHILDAQEEYTVTFNPNNGQEAFSYPVRSDGTVEEPPNPTVPAGKSYFSGWYALGSDVDGPPFDFSAVLTANLSLEARYSDHFTVTFKNAPGENGQVIHTAQVDPGRRAEPYQPGSHELAAPDGEIFAYWYEENTNPDIAFNFGEAVTDNLTLVAKYSGRYSVVFISEGTQAEPILVDMGQPIPVEQWPENPTRMGYEFRYWSAAPEGVEYDRTQEEDGDLILYAVWTAEEVSYTVVHWLEKPDITGDPGTSSSNFAYHSSETYRETAGTAVAEIHFSPAHIPHAYYSGNHTSNSDTVLGNGTTVVNLYYRLTEYTFTFDLDPGVGTLLNRTATLAFNNNPSMVYEQKYTMIGGTTGNQYSFTAKMGQNISDLWPSTANATLTRTGPSISNADFRGWIDDYGFLGIGRTYLVTHRETLTADLLPSNGTSRTLVARWASGTKGYEVNYYFEQLMHESGDVEYRNKYYVLDNVYSQSYESNTSSLSPKDIAGMSIVNGGSQSGNPKNFYYNRDRYNLTFRLQGGVFASELPTVGDYTPSGVTYGGVMYGEQLSHFLPDDPVRTENGITYLFDGWYYDAECYNVVDFTADTMPNSGLTLYAKWTSTEYRADFYDSTRSTEPVATTYVVNGYVQMPDTYVTGQFYAGKGEFLGWQWRIGSQIFDFSFDTVVRGNIQLYAKWKTEDFRVEYHLGDGTGTPPEDSERYLQGVHATVLAPDGLTPPNGKVFVGWEREGDSRTYYPGGTVQITGDVTLTARFVDASRTVTLTYHPNGGTGPEVSIILEQGAQVTLLGADAFVMEGAVLTGWSTNSDGSGGVEYPLNASITVDRDMDLYAVWQLKLHTISFTALGGSLSGQTFFTVPHATPWGNIAVPVVVDSGDAYFSHWDPSLPQADEPITGDLAYTAVFLPKTPITITAHSATKVYDGAPLTAADYTLSPANPDLTVTGVTVSSSITDVGSATNDVDVTRIKIMQNGNDVTNRFTIRPVNGTLTVTQRPITIVGDSNSVPYDGSAKTVNTYTVSGAGLVPGHRIVAGISALGTGTFPGVYTVAVSIDNGSLCIEDASGTDVTRNYALSTQNGELTITEPDEGDKLEWSITVDGATKTYDGTIQTHAGSISSDLPAGYQLVGYSVRPASGRNAGQYDQELVMDAHARIFNEQGEDVSSIFKAPTVYLGKLTIEKAPLLVIPNDVSITYGEAVPAYSLQYSGFAGDDTESVLSTQATVTCAYTQGSDAGTYPITATGAEADNYTFTYEEGTLTVVTKTIAVAADSRTVVYDGTLHEVDTFTHQGLLPGHRITGGVTAYGSGTYPGSYPVEITIENPVILDADGSDKTASYAIDPSNGGGILTVRTPQESEKLDWTVTANSKTTTYNGALRQVTGYTTSLPVDYRVEGLTVSGSGTDAGIYTVSVGGSHTILDAQGVDVTNYYRAPVVENGELTIEKAKLTIFAVDRTIPFGTVPTYTARYEGFQGNDDESCLTPGPSFSSTYTQGAPAGTYTITPYGANAKNYDISYLAGTLTVLEDSDTMQAGASDVTATYDGTLHAIGVVVSGVTDATIEYRLPGESWSTAHPNLVDVSDSSLVEYRVSKAGYTTVTGSARVTIQAKPITVQADSATRAYTGQTISVHTSGALTGGSLVSGHTLEVTANGSGTDVGSYPIGVTSVAVLAGDDNVSGNYAVTTQDGILTIARNSPGGGSGGSSGGSSTPDSDRTNPTFGGTTTIPNSDVPLTAPSSGLVTIPDEPVPVGALPSAGGIPAEAFILLGVCLIGGGGACKLRSRRCRLKGGTPSDC